MGTGLRQGAQPRTADQGVQASFQHVRKSPHQSEGRKTEEFHGPEH